MKQKGEKEKKRNTKRLENKTRNRKWTQCDERKNVCAQHTENTLHTKERLQKKYVMHSRKLNMLEKGLTIRKKRKKMMVTTKRRQMVAFMKMNGMYS
jgi:hypothetical protein